MAATFLPVGHWLVHTLLAGGLLLALGAVLVGCARQPAVRQRVLEVTLLAGLAAAVLCAFPAWLPWSLPLWPAEASAAPPPADLPPEPPAGPLRDDAARSVPPPVAWEGDAEAPMIMVELLAAVPDAMSAADARADADHAAAAPRADLPPGGLMFDWRAWLPYLAAGYVAVLGVFLVRFLVGVVGLWRLVRTCHPAPAEVAALFDALVRDRGCRPRLLVCPRLALPVSFGLWRPVVLIPVQLARRSTADQLRWVLVHELAHVERRDAWGGLLLALAQAVYFPLPWFWWLRRQLRLCQEYIADAAAAAVGPSEDYAEYLVALSALAPQPLPAGARVTGVLGIPSDLSRRVIMLVNASRPVERSCPRWLSWSAGAALFGVAVLVSGISLTAEAAVRINGPLGGKEPGAPTPSAPFNVLAQPEPPAPPKPPAADLDRLQKELEQLQEQLKKLQGLKQEQIEEVRRAIAEAQVRLAEARKQAEARRQLEWAARQRFVIVGHPNALLSSGRLGVRLEAPGETMASQLDLPKGQGLVVAGVTPDSAAAKAGIQTHDILLELAGKPVPSNPAEFARMVAAVKVGQPVEAVVLRKGKRTTIKGLSLPEQADGQLFPIFIGPDGQLFIDPAQRPGVPGFRVVPAVPGRLLPNRFQLPADLVPGVPRVNVRVEGADGGFVSTTVIRRNDQLTIRHEEGRLKIEITGTVAGGKATPTSISIEEDGTATRYDSLEKVPEKHRAKVKGLLELGERDEFRVKWKVKEPA
jgi:beta-lactamase regulating signal transducer with metallopeptidase domain